MDGLDLKRLSEICDAVLDAPIGEREELLKRLCGDDERLRNQVHGVLRELQEEGEGDEARSGFMSVPVLSVPNAEVEGGEGSAGGWMPKRIGPYELIRLLGEGGMGSVYEARQDNPRRLVAVKVLRAGHFSGEPLRRFVRESQVLGMLHHPGIAQVYEAGMAETGVGKVPYFAMELIRGQPLNVFVASNDLGPRAKLELIAYVCDAVDHAHQQRIVHRDLKPANILIEESSKGRGVAGGGAETDGLRGARPKILDFGVARAAADLALGGATLQTDAGQIIGTLTYMSPEQVAGDPTRIDARSDVYSLGVMAYEMLAGRVPIDVRGRSVPEATRSIVTDEPTRLRTLDTRLAGDVDTIVAKALEKDASRRYQSAAALAADIRRYLRDQPIEARPATRLYQLRKFTRRNRAVVAGAGATLITLLAGVATTAFWAVRATERRALAEERADDQQRKAYRASIAAAQAALERGQTVAARGHLGGTPEALRGWEWHYLNGQLDRSDRTIELEPAGRHTAVLESSYAFLNHAERPVLMNWMRGDEVPCEPATGRETAYAMALSPTGDCFAVCREYSTAIWNARTGKPIRVLENEPRFEHTPFTPDGSRMILAASSPRRLIWIDPMSGVIDREEPIDTVVRSFPTVSRDGERLLVEIRDQVSAMIRLPEFVVEWTAPGAHPRFVDGGRRVLLYTGVGSTAPVAHLLDAANGREVWSLLLENVQIDRGGAASRVLEMSPDGSMLAHLTNSGTIRLLSAHDRTTLGTLSGLGPRVTGIFNGVVFSEDGSWVAAQSRHDNIKVWNIAQSAIWPQVKTREELDTFAATISPDCSVGIAANWGEVVAWDLATGAPKWSVSPSLEFVQSVAINASLTRVYVGGDRGTLRVLDAADGASLVSKTPNRHGDFGSGWVRSLACSADGTSLFAGFASGEVLSLDARTLDEFRRAKFGDRGVTEIAVSPSGRRFACIVDGEPSKVVIADVGTLAIQQETTCEGAASLVWSRDETMLAVGHKGSVRLIGLDGRERGQLNPTQGTQTCVWFSDDGSRIFACSDAGMMNVWLARSGDLVLELPLPSQAKVLAGRMSSDGRRVHVISSTSATLLFEIDKAGEATAAARDVVRRGRALYLRAKSIGYFLPETLDAIQREVGVPEAVRAEAKRQAVMLTEHPAFLNNQAYLKAETRSSDAAVRRGLREAEAAVARTPDPFARLTLGILLYHVGRYQEAADRLREADAGLRMVRPAWGDGPPEMSAYLGLCEAALGNTEEAERWFSIFDRVVEEARYKGGDEAERCRKLVAPVRVGGRGD